LGHDGTWGTLSTGVEDQAGNVEWTGVSGFDLNPDRYRARARHYSGASGVASNVVSVDTHEEQPLPAVTSLAAAPSQTGVHLSWSNPSDDRVAGVIVVRVLGSTPVESPTDGPVIFDTESDPSATAVDDTGLQPSTTYSYTVFVHDASSPEKFSAAATVTTLTLSRGPYWHGPWTVDEMVGAPSGISCPSSTFCMAVDYAGDALTFDGSKWSPPNFVEAPNWADHAFAFVGVSCPTTTFCMAIDGDGYARTWNGASWSAALPVDPRHRLRAVSCATPQSCVAVSDPDPLEGSPGGRAETYDGSSWSSPVVVDQRAYNMDDVSCATADFCVAADDAGDVVVRDASGWETPTWLGNQVNAVSCVSANFCVAGEWSGASSTFDGTSWSAPASVNPSDPQVALGFASIRCTSATWCIALDSRARSYTFDGTEWSGPTTAPNDPSWDGLACVSSSACRVISADGVESAYDGTTWTAPSTFDPSDSAWGNFSSVSCPSTTFCALVTHRGHAQTVSGNSWSRPALPDGNADLVSVSCTSGDFCMAVSADGHAVAYDGTTWSSPAAIDDSNAGMSAVSCASTTACLAVDAAGNAVTYDADGWGSPTRIDADPLTAVSCPTVTHCVAVDDHGRTLTLDNGNWEDPTPVLPNALTSISCPQTTFCAVVDAQGDVATFNAGSWSTSVTGGDPYVSVSCPTSGYCRAVDANGSDISYDGTNWKPGLVDSSVTMTSVSCSEPDVCMAADNANGVYQLFEDQPTL
jgi:hypothetical protein